MLLRHNIYALNDRCFYWNLFAFNFSKVTFFGGTFSKFRKALEMLSRIRGNTASNVEMSEEAIHAGLVGNFYVIGRKEVMKLMDEAEALGSQAVTRMMAHK